jgi:hypothetical protein
MNIHTKWTVTQSETHKHPSALLAARCLPGAPSAPCKIFPCSSESTRMPTARGQPKPDQNASTLSPRAAALHHDAVPHAPRRARALCWVRRGANVERAGALAKWVRMHRRRLRRAWHAPVETRRCGRRRLLRL